MGFLGTLLLFIVIDMGITLLLGLLGTPIFIIDITVSLVMAFVFALFRHDRRLGPFYKNPMFHRNLALVFIVLLGISYITGICYDTD